MFRPASLMIGMTRIALQWPAYGGRRITAELKRRGWKVNHKRVQRITRGQPAMPAAAAQICGNDGFEP